MATIVDSRGKDRRRRESARSATQRRSAIGLERAWKWLEKAKFQCPPPEYVAVAPPLMDNTRMADLNQAMPKASEAPRPVIYEHPLHERVRTFLRLEFLFEQAGYHAARDSVWSSRAAIDNVLDILAIISRGDVRSEALKELEKHASVLGQYQFRPDVDCRATQCFAGNYYRTASVAWRNRRPACSITQGQRIP